MLRVSPRRVVAGALIAMSPAIAAGQVVDDFESYLLGTLPGPTWLDAGAVIPTPPHIPSFPSGYVIATTDALGNPTKAVTTVGDVAHSKGIYTPVPLATFYSLRADVRIDRYGTPVSPFTTNDWPMQVTFGQNGVDNWAWTPQAGIYASTTTQGWRLFALTASTSADIDLGVAATPGVWYTVSQTLDVATGRFHSQIFDAATGNVLVDQVNVIPGWNPAEIQFDAFAFFGGETSADAAVGNIGVIDNVNVVVRPVPEPTTIALLALGLVALGVCGRRRR